jgi:hypothetical protein
MFWVLEDCCGICPIAFKIRGVRATVDSLNELLWLVRTSDGHFVVAAHELVGCGLGATSILVELVSNRLIPPVEYAP